MKWKTSTYLPSEKNRILYGHKIWSHHDVIQYEPTMR